MYVLEKEQSFLFAKKVINHGLGHVLLYSPFKFLVKEYWAAIKTRLLCQDHLVSFWGKRTQQKFCNFSFNDNNLELTLPSCKIFDWNIVGQNFNCVVMLQKKKTNGASTLKCSTLLFANISNQAPIENQQLQFACSLTMTTFVCGYLVRNGWSCIPSPLPPERWQNSWQNIRLNFSPKIQ